MKKNNKKGFTIVELVIVIAVIAILSAVLIPTFSGVAKKANESAALQSATSALTVVLTEEDGELDADYTYYFKATQNGDAYWFEVKDNKLEKVKAPTLAADLVPDYAKTKTQTAGADTVETTDDKYSAGMALEDLSANVVVYKVANA